MNYFYVYCIANGLNQDIIHTSSECICGGNRVEVYRFKDICAITSEVESTEFSEESIKERLNNLEWIKQKSFLHENVVEEIMARGAVLPMSFYSIYKSKQDVLGFLENNYFEIRENLWQTEDLEEWSVKVFCDTNLLKEGILSSMGENINRNVQEILEEVKKDATDAVVKEVKNNKEGSLQMVLNVILLLRKGKSQKLSKTISKLDRLYTGSGFTIEAIGPWPLYNFVKPFKAGGEDTLPHPNSNVVTP